jgi:hypothetical protein
MSRRRVILKWSLVGVYWLVQSAVIYSAFAILWMSHEAIDLADALRELIDVLSDADYILWISPFVVSITAMQMGFLLPIRRPGVRSGRGARWGIAAVGGFGIAGTAAFFLLFINVALELTGRGWRFETLGLWSYWGTLGLGWVAATLVLRRFFRDGFPILASVAIAGFAVAALAGGVAMAALGLVRLVTGEEIDEHIWGWAWIAVLVPGWIAATPLLLAFCRMRTRESGLSRIASLLFIGTVVEGAAVIPLDIMIRRRTDCYCAEGTFFALLACIGVGLFALGPAILLAPLARRRRRWLGGRCEICGYDMSGCRNAPRCPECGAGWRGSEEAPG